MNSKEMRVGQIFKKFIEDLKKEGYRFENSSVSFEMFDTFKEDDSSITDKPYRMYFLTNR